LRRFFKNNIKKMNESKEVLKIEGLSKKFCSSLRRSMYYGFVDIMKAMFGITKPETSLRKDEFWALNNINLNLVRGETLGIIGVNGSGKTTLLRLISGIYPPTAGKITIKGRIGTLIALGAGFHPHLSGRDNIYLNGVILGMTKKELNVRMDEIVRFADIGDFIDAPVATYSSGMTVRLGFSIAIHSEPDILLIDEILAVGDINFQKKCLEKIDQMKQNKGVIFITHTLSHIYRICDRVLWIQNGSIKLEGKPEHVVREYVNSSIKRIELDAGTDVLSIIESINNPSLKFLNSQNENINEFVVHSPVAISAEFDTTEAIDNIICEISILSTDSSYITTMSSHGKPMNLAKGRNLINCTINSLSINPGTYSVIFLFYKTPGFNLLEMQYTPLTIIENPAKFAPYMHGYYREQGEWNNDIR
jgi:lipopolysaccharide transport system ATP-binding protein